MPLTTPLILVIKTSLITLMVALGLELRLEDLAVHRHRPWVILRVVLGSCLLVPLVALVVLLLPISQQMSAGARFGIALMALSPSAPLTLRKAGLRGGDAHEAAVLQVVAALLAVVSIPLLGDLFRATHHLRGWDILPRQVALQVGVLQVVPLASGLLLGYWRPDLRERWARPVQRAAFLVTLLMVALILAMVMPTLLTFIRGNLLAITAMVVMTGAALGIGYALGGDSRSERLTAALVTSMRNPGLALLFAVTHGKNVPGVKLAIVTYLLVTILATVPFLRWARQARTP
ncbi:MAG: transporter [Cyanobacteriota bacterium]|nr:transporter [Cyanobacteriota bacterium]